MRSASSPRAVSISTGTSEVRRSCLSTSKPSMPGSITSRMIAWYWPARALSSPSGPVWADSTS